MSTNQALERVALDERTGFAQNGKFTLFPTSFVDVGFWRHLCSARGDSTIKVGVAIWEQRDSKRARHPLASLLMCLLTQIQILP